MYGHAKNLFPACAVEACTAPGMITLDDGRVMCAAHAISQLDQF